jgi:long-chain acyl-CoA synthetase
MRSLDNDSLEPETAQHIAQARRTAFPPDREPHGSFASIGELLAQRVQEMPNKNWLTFMDEMTEPEVQNQLSPDRWSYSEFYEQACRVAHLLQKAELVPGDRIATLMNNDPRTVLIYFGAWLLGLTVVPINITEEDERIAYILDNAAVKAVFALREQTGRKAALSAADVLWYQVGGEGQEGFISFDETLSGIVPLASPPEIKSSQECLIIYTSGTTGAPKGVVLEQSNLLVDAKAITEWHRFNTEDRAMNVLPIHHVNGIIVTLMTPLWSGGSVVMNRRFRAGSFWRTLAAEHCTWVSVVPTVLAFLIEVHDDLTQHDLSRFRHIVCGAGPLSVELARRFHETFGVRVVHGYGLSETTCYSCFLPIDLDDNAYRYWMTECGFPSIGCPLPVNDMAIHDANGNALPPERRGEIVIRGYNVMRCYYQRPDVNRDTFAHGWFRSGDEGFYRVGEDGRDYYFITGRLKELIIRGGVNYSPFDIDEVLNAIPGVKAGMAVGFENEFYGEEVGAYVQLETGASLTEQEILQACRAELPFEKSPKVVLFGETFPVTSTGKYQRSRLKPLFAEWKNTQFRKGKKA